MVFSKAFLGLVLMKYVREGDLQGVKNCIVADTIDPFCTVPYLTYATNNLLIHRFTKWDFGCEWTPLMYAIFNRQMLIVRYLVEEMKCELDQVDSFGVSALWIAAENGYVIELQYLLEKGADKNKASNNGRSPVYIAARLGHLEAVQLLHDKGADMHKVTSNYSSPLCIAIQNGHLAVVQFLLDFCDVNVNETPDLLSPLYLAAENGHLKLVQCLLAHNANVNLASFSGATPLFIAAQNGHLTVVDCLLKKGANIDKVARYNNVNGVTPLDIAIQSSQSNGERSKEYLEVIKSLNEHILKQQNACVAVLVADAVAVSTTDDDEVAEPFSKRLRR